MDDHIKDLLKLQDLDRKLDRTLEDLSRIPKEIDIHDQEIRKHRDRFSEHEKCLEEVKAGQKQSIVDKQDAKERLADYKNNLLSLKTNEEYRAMLQQISTVEQMIDDLDSRSIELMYKEDATTLEIETARKILDRSVQRAEKRKEFLQTEKRDLEQEVESLQVAREKRVTGVNIRFLRKYEQLRAVGKGLAVVGLIGGACGGCMTNIPPQSAVEIASGATFTCPICGRFVVWTDDSSFAGD